MTTLAITQTRAAEGRARIATRAEVEACELWPVSFRHHRQDHRYYRIVEDTLKDGMEHRYLLLEDGEGAVRAVQPMFVLDQDVLQGSPKKVQKVAERVRMFFPRFLKMRTLMVGCAAGEGNMMVEPGEDQEHAAWIGRGLRRALPGVAKEMGASLIVMKEFSSGYREALAGLEEEGGYSRIPSFPMTRVGIGYASFDEYLEKRVGKVSRKSLRRKLRKTEAAAEEMGGIELEVRTDVSDCVDELYELYLQVYHKSELQFEKLTKEYLCALGREMPEKARFFVWRMKGKAVAFSVCMVQGDSIYDLYIGMDYSVAIDLHLYFWTFRDIVSWAMGQGLQWYCSTSLGYDPKLHLGCHLLPLDLYVRHRSGVANFVLQRVSGLLDPTKGEGTLREFPNYGEMTGRSDGGEEKRHEGTKARRHEGVMRGGGKSGEEARGAELMRGETQRDDVGEEVVRSEKRSGNGRKWPGHWFLNPYLQLMLGAILVTASELMLKKGAEASAAGGGTSLFGVEALGSLWTWGGITTYILDFVSWLYVLRYMSLGIAFTLINVTYVMIPLASWVFLHEHITGRRWVGIVLVLVGILMVAQSQAKAEEKL